MPKNHTTLGQKLRSHLGYQTGTKVWDRDEEGTSPFPPAATPAPFGPSLAEKSIPGRPGRPKTERRTLCEPRKEHGPFVTRANGDMPAEAMGVKARNLIDTPEEPLDELVVQGGVDQLGRRRRLSWSRWG